MPLLIIFSELSLLLAVNESFQYSIVVPLLDTLLVLSFWLTDFDYVLIHGLFCLFEFVGAQGPMGPAGPAGARGMPVSI